MNISSFGRRWITLANAAVGRSALGLGTAATVDTGTTTGTIPLNDAATFTPAFSASGSTFSYLVQQGLYTKIGREVHFIVNLVLNTSGNTLTANTLTITGLPFTIASGSYATARWTNSTTAFINVTGYWTGATTTINLAVMTAATTASIGTAALANTLLHATNGSGVFISGVYYV